VPGKLLDIKRLISIYVPAAIAVLFLMILFWLSVARTITHHTPHPVDNLVAASKSRLRGVISTYSITPPGSTELVELSTLVFPDAQANARPAAGSH